MNVKTLIPSDCSKVAELHLKAFPSFFLSGLGKSFLNAFYISIIKHSDGIAVGLFDNETVVAFAVGSSKKRGFYTIILKKNGLRLLLKSLPSLLRSPQNIIRLLKALKTKDSNEDYILNNATLLSICVNNSNTEKGMGSKIITAFEELAFSSSESISLTTDATNNDYVNNFYQKNGYLLLKQFNQGNRKMNLYNKTKNA